MATGTVNKRHSQRSPRLELMLRYQGFFVTFIQFLKDYSKFLSFSSLENFLLCVLRLNIGKQHLTIQVFFF